jgi:hypothetical protein
MVIKSIKKVDIPDGMYRGLQSAYTVVVLLPDWSETESIKVNVGVKCIDCKSTIKVKDGWLYIIV